MGSVARTAQVAEQRQHAEQRQQADVKHAPRRPAQPRQDDASLRTRGVGQGGKTGWVGRRGESCACGLLTHSSHEALTQHVRAWAPPSCLPHTTPFHHARTDTVTTPVGASIHVMEPDARPDQSLFSHCRCESCVPHPRRRVFRPRIPPKQALLHVWGEWGGTWAIDYAGERG